MRRLRTDYIDIYQVHWPDPLITIEETADAMLALLRQGKIRATAYLTDWCGVEHLRGFGVRFTAPLVIGRTVVLSGEVTAATGGLAQVDLTAQDGDVVLVRGQAEVVVTG